jgi:hypothetical protein
MAEIIPVTEAGFVVTLSSFKPLPLTLLFALLVGYAIGSSR